MGSGQATQVHHSFYSFLYAWDTSLKATNKTKTTSSVVSWLQIRFSVNSFIQFCLQPTVSKKGCLLSAWWWLNQFLPWTSWLGLLFVLGKPNTCFQLASLNRSFFPLYNQCSLFKILQPVFLIFRERGTRALDIGYLLGHGFKVWAVKFVSPF